MAADLSTTLSAFVLCQIYLTAYCVAQVRAQVWAVVAGKVRRKGAFAGLSLALAQYQTQARVRHRGSTAPFSDHFGGIAVVDCDIRLQNTDTNCSIFFILFFFDVG
jgi:hypothetical protein